MIKKKAWEYSQAFFFCDNLRDLREKIGIPQISQIIAERD